MLELSKRLLYYKRKEIESAIVFSSKDREIGTRYGENGFGKRPDILVYENDVLESVKNGATSFHISEERWDNPMQLSTEMKREELDELRKGWDLVLDIDCPYWYYSKLITYLFIKALKIHGIKSISCKFSGNKGFHLGVPFEAFPEEVNNIPIKNWFPEGPKKIALYLLEYISNNFIEIKENGEIIFDKLHKTTREELSKLTGKTEKELSMLRCVKCKKKVEKISSGKKTEFVCSKCGMHIVKTDNQKYLTCPKCNLLMQKFEIKDLKCSNCGSKEKPKEIFDPLSIVDVDTILISSRHMFRSPFSMHEKTGLVSLPISIGKVLTFEKDNASSEKINISAHPTFLDISKTTKNEAQNLMISAFDFGKEDLQFKTILKGEVDKNKQYKKYDDLTSAIPLELFPPCILKILEGLEDGKKRSMFVLTNFLTSVGWNHDKAEELLMEWNKKNKEQLKEGLIRSQIRYHKQKNKKILPPNCREYYQDFHVCFPDSLCEKIKNPVQYSKRKVFLSLKLKGTRERLTEEQKEMRRKHRENLKKDKDPNKDRT